MLTDPEPIDVDEPLPPDPAEEEAAAPVDRHLLASPPDVEAAAGPAAADTEEPPFDPDYDTASPDPGIAEMLAAAQAAWGVQPAAVDPAEELYWARLDEEYRWDMAAVPRARMIQLNEHAADYFTARYPQSWAAGHLRDRLGTDLIGDERYSPGYAPADWTHLVDHLRRNGATDEEIVATGLGVYASTGRVIDRFRDRLTFPIHGPDGEIHGFIGRRNPDRDQDEKAGPKYLNTGGNDLFGKGDQLFGLHEARADLAAGATPVLVEGPVDAIAVTLACDGQGVGVAPLGTAFTDRQADQLRPYIGTDRPGVVVATDADPAGERAAEHAYWQLTARGDDPRRLVMPAGMDPAEILQSGSREELLEALIGAGSLAGHLIDRRIAAHAPTGTAAEQTLAIRFAAEVIGALPPPRWLEHIDHVTQVLDAAPGSVHLAVIDAGTAWVLDPAGQACARQIEVTRSAQPALRDNVISAQAGQRWAALAAQVDARLPESEDWPVLAGAMNRAHVAGYDVAGNLARLATSVPLPAQGAAGELRWRLLTDWAATAPAPPPQRAAPAATPTHVRYPEEAARAGRPDPSRPVSGPDR